MDTLLFWLRPRLYFSPDGKTTIIADKNLYALDVAKKELSTLIESDKTITDARYTADGDALIYEAVGGLTLYDLKSKKQTSLGDGTLAQLILDSDRLTLVGQTEVSFFDLEGKSTGKVTIKSLPTTATALMWTQDATAIIFATTEEILKLSVKSTEK